MMNILLVMMLYAVVFVGSEVAYRKLHVSFLFSRKFAHIGGSVISCMLPFFISNMYAVIFGIIFTLIIFVSKRNHFFKGIHDTKGVSIGEVLFPLGLALSALVVWPMSVVAYQGSCLVLGLSDGLAGYIGNMHGRRSYKVLGGTKTIEGSMIFLIFTIMIFVAYYMIYGDDISVVGLTLLALYAIGVTAVEAILSRGWDNLVIPVVAGLALILVIS